MPIACVSAETLSRLVSSSYPPDSQMDDGSGGGVGGRGGDGDGDGDDDDSEVSVS